MKVRDLINRSFRILGVIASGENATAAEASDALQALNSMLGSWSNNGLLIYETKRETLNLVTGQQSFTIGANVAADFNTARPTQITGASYLLNGQEYLIDLIPLEVWNEITDKNVSSISDKLYYETSFPLGKIYLYPKPESNAQLILSSLKPLVAFTSINDEVELPPGYEECIVFNLAKSMAPEFGKSLSAEASDIAIQSKLDVERTNYKPIISASDIYGLSEFQDRRYNIIRGS